MGSLIIMCFVPIYMVSFLYMFVLYNNNIPKTPLWYLFQTILIVMILIPMMLLPELIYKK